MSRLELPNLGTFPERYDRIVAATLAQLNAFTPEPGAESVPAFVEETGFTYKWDGSTWGIG